MKSSNLQVAHKGDATDQIKDHPSKGKFVKAYSTFVNKVALRQDYTTIAWAGLFPDLILAITSGVTGYQVGEAFELSAWACYLAGVAAAVSVDGILALQKKKAEAEALAGGFLPKTPSWFYGMVKIISFTVLTAVLSILANDFIKDAYERNRKVGAQEENERLESSVAVLGLVSVDEDATIISLRRQLKEQQDIKKARLDNTTPWVREQYLAGQIDAESNQCATCYKLKAFSKTMKPVEEKIANFNAQILERTTKINDGNQKRKDEAQARARKDIDATNATAEKLGNRLRSVLWLMEPLLAFIGFTIFLMKVAKRRQQGKAGIKPKGAIALQTVLDLIQAPIDRFFVWLGLLAKEQRLRGSISQGAAIDQINTELVPEIVTTPAPVPIKKKQADWVQKAVIMRRDQQMTYMEIAKAVGRAYGTVHKALKARGL